MYKHSIELLTGLEISVKNSCFADYIEANSPLSTDTLSRSMSVPMGSEEPGDLIDEILAYEEGCHEDDCSFRSFLFSQDLFRLNWISRIVDTTDKQGYKPLVHIIHFLTIIIIPP